jgi:hypothetical protein
MPTWLHWILTVILAYPLFIIAGILVGSTSGIACRLVQLFLTGNIGSAMDRLVFSKQRILHDIIVLIMSILAFVMGIYFLYNEIHVWASILLVVCANLLYHLLPTNLFIQETILIRIWMVFVYTISAASSLYFCYVILGLF